MADYFVASGGSNTAPYDTWAKAATALATALAAATVNGDRVIIQYNAVPAADMEMAVATTWTAAADIQVISASNDGGSAWTPTAMGISSWLGNSTTNRTVTLDGAYNVYWYGITFRTASTTAANIIINPSDYGQFHLDGCYLWCGSTSANAIIRVSITGGTTNHYTKLSNSTLRFGNAGQSFSCMSGVLLEGCVVSSAGSALTTLFSTSSNAADVGVVACDLSHITGTLVGNNTAGRGVFRFSNCEFGANVTRLASQTSGSRASAEVYVSNCYNGDIHYAGEHHTALGSSIVSTAIYANNGNTYDGTNHFSIVVTTTGNSNFGTPYESPWIEQYHSGTSAIQPSLEVLRDGSATAYKDNEVWAEFSYQGTTGQPLAVLNNSDRMALNGNAANQETGTLGAGDWTGEGATAWFGQLRPSGTITPVEIGPLKARVCMAIASFTVYVDPTLRGV